MERRKAPAMSGTKWYRNGRRNIGLVPSMSMLAIRPYDDESNDDLEQHRIEAMGEQRARDGATRRTAGATGRAALRSGMPIVLQIQWREWPRASFVVKMATRSCIVLAIMLLLNDMNKNTVYISHDPSLVLLAPFLDTR